MESQLSVSRPRSKGALSALVRVLGFVDTAIGHLEAVLLGLGILLMAGNTVANVVGRTVFEQSIFFSEELNQFLIVLVTFVGAGYAARHGRHIRMSALYDQLNHLGRKILMVVICAGTAAVMFFLAYYSAVYVIDVAQGGEVTSSLRLPVYWTLLWIPVGLTITGIQYVLTLVRNLISEDVYVSFSQVDAYEDPEAHTGADASV
ncbi:TRAP-type C4-dicarboxylate transport system, small permease component [Limimonas halophila]|uniref:TRAP transporter small permease protein n=1 Tax=Limimonas halophila TaxID=1082479 RepID=A0A1G7LKX8_9PROT|nr:TRAP transporter small permease [Limimonas halophila]SDF50168.1 TRAP-type C4-dicarboxylate transport system, small permease component [Limimonas halophila]